MAPDVIPPEVGWPLAIVLGIIWAAIEYAHRPDKRGVSEHYRDET